jgi:hypothetical protein
MAAGELRRRIAAGADWWYRTSRAHLRVCWYSSLLEVTRIGCFARYCCACGLRPGPTRSVRRRWRAVSAWDESCGSNRPLKALSLRQKHPYCV